MPEIIILYSYIACALKKIKPAAKFSPSDIIYHPYINKAALLSKYLCNTENNKRYYQ